MKRYEMNLLFDEWDISSFNYQIATIVSFMPFWMQLGRKYALDTIQPFQSLTASVSIKHFPDVFIQFSCYFELNMLCRCCIAMGAIEVALMKKRSYGFLLTLSL